MSEEDEPSLEERVRNFAQNLCYIEKKAQDFAREIADAVVERLLELFEQRENQDIHFEQWLGTQFEYDHFFTFNIFRSDPELKSLVESIDATQGGANGRWKVVKTINERFKECGYQVGFNEMLIDIDEINVR
jgi:hypothetical protein